MRHSVLVVRSAGIVQTLTFDRKASAPVAAVVPVAAVEVIVVAAVGRMEETNFAIAFGSY